MVAAQILCVLVGLALAQVGLFYYFFFFFFSGFSYLDCVGCSELAPCRR